MSGKDYQRFLDSMVIGFDQWHDGIGYDLRALERLDAGERLSIEALLIRKLNEAGNWRDVEALAALGTATARAAVEEARNHRNAKVRYQALGILLRDPEPAPEWGLEDLVIRAVEEGRVDMAERMPTPRVKQALLNCARNAKRFIRAHAAAMLMYLCGLAPEPFDWRKRPFFLRFAGNDPTALLEAWEELRRRTGL